MGKKIDYNRISNSEYITFSRVQKITMFIASAAILLASLYLYLFTHGLYSFAPIGLLIIVGFAFSAVVSAVYFRLFSRVYIATIITLILLLLLICGIFAYGGIMERSNAICDVIGGMGSCTDSAALSAFALCDYFIPPVSILCVIAFIYQVAAVLSVHRK